MAKESLLLTKYTRKFHFLSLLSFKIQIFVNFQQELYDVCHELRTEHHICKQRIENSGKENLKQATPYNFTASLGRAVPLSFHAFPSPVPARHKIGSGVAKQQLDNDGTASNSTNNRQSADFLRKEEGKTEAVRVHKIDPFSSEVQYGFSYNKKREC